MNDLPDSGFVPDNSGIGIGGQEMVSVKSVSTLISGAVD